MGSGNSRKSVDTRLAQLHELAMNLWWSWHPVGRRPFAALDPGAWEALNHDPLAVLRQGDPTDREYMLSHDSWGSILQEAIDRCDEYLQSRSWFQKNQKKSDAGMKIAYFCCEYALHESIPQYSGGLGVLAGDHLKAASDLGIPIVGVGLLYKSGYYRQRYAPDGSTEVLRQTFDYSRMPIIDTGIEITCPLEDRLVRLRIWKMQVGRVDLYLLDANLPSNSDEDQLLTEGLYRGAPDRRMKQQVILGVGGVIALRALREKVTVYHLNEGHAAFVGLERFRDHRVRGFDVDSAWDRIRNSPVFTTHTPVPAGHDRYCPDKVWNAIKFTARQAGLKKREIKQLGSERTGDDAEPFCMTALALHQSKFVNGVAQLHGDVTRQMWKGYYGAKDADEVPITHITNGVHIQTWLDPGAAEFWRKRIGLKFGTQSLGKTPWHKATDVDPDEFWDLRNKLRRRFIWFLRNRLIAQSRRRGDSPDQIGMSASAFSEDALTIGFARRFATYKRAPLILYDHDRLSRILQNAKRPVQLVFAGKPHPQDAAGQEDARKIYQLARKPEFVGRIALLEDYDMHVGRMMTSGVDVWLNNPIRPHEASGTSGMKCPMHGGINCSILDGWWPEGFNGRNGWQIGDSSERRNRHEQDKHDANALYKLLSNDIIPEFYDRNSRGVPRKWVKRALEGVATVPSQFNATRMVGDYLNDSYRPAHASQNHDSSTHL